MVLAAPDAAAVGHRLLGWLDCAEPCGGGRTCWLGKTKKSRGDENLRRSDGDLMGCARRDAPRRHDRPSDLHQIFSDLHPPLLFS
jgi:hypothetical protein